MTVMTDTPSTLRGRGAASYVAALVLVSGSTLIGLVLAPRWGNSAVDLLFLPAVLASAIFLGFGPALVAAVGSTLAYNYFFTEPVHTLRIHDPADFVTVVVLFLVAAAASQLAASVRNQARIAEGLARRNATIAGIARELLACATQPEIAQKITAEFARLFDCNAILLSPVPTLHIVASAPAPVELTPSDFGAAAQVAASGKAAGRGIDPVSTVEWQLHPVHSQDAVIAIVGVARDDGVPAVSDDRQALLQSLLDQLALALERARLDVEGRNFTALRERDRLRSALLASLDQDLGPPIAMLAEASGQLRRNGASEDRDSIAVIAQQTARLQRYLANLHDLGNEPADGPIVAGGITIDLARRLVTRDGADVHLTPKEFAVLAELAKRPGRVLSHAQLLRAAWGPAQEKQNEYLRVAVRALRQKLEQDPSRPSLILNEPAVGYRLSVTAAQS